MIGRTCIVKANSKSGITETRLNNKTVRVVNLIPNRPELVEVELISGSIASTIIGKRATILRSCLFIP
jgi:hypothetical protein